ncbi:ketopantoate reductase family protein [Colwellia piezophila]|uniref:ketopantoate reductase family protein n=1 Tax=Colwellia piezophila TaxID=211668 RepID=UPI0003A85072|nr:2-dehydropantoate 2-reductase [Colwellia piezophila]
MTDTLNNIVIVGQGAMGLLWYHHLSQQRLNNHRQKVTLLASNQALLDKAALNSAKYQLTPYRQEQTKSYSLKYSQKADINSANIIILCLKSFHIASAVERIAKDISPHCLIILAHNGMGTFAGVRKLLPNKQVILAMLTTHGCFRTAPLAITHTGLGQSDIGLLAGELSNEQQNRLTNRLNLALPHVSFHQDIKTKQWLKLAINCVINPITALNDIDNGEVNNKKFTKQIKLLLVEIIEVSKKEHIDLELSELQAVVHKVANATARNCSSMRSDTRAGKATEVDYINGYIHSLGQQNNIATPENSRLWQQVLNLNHSLNRE